MGKSEMTRAGFDAWLAKTYLSSAEWDEARNCYKDASVQMAWQAYRDLSALAEQEPVAQKGAAMRYEQWAGTGPIGGPVEWPIVDRNTCGPIHGIPRRDQWMAVAYDHKIQQLICDALNNLRTSPAPGTVSVPVEPTEAMLDRTVAFALNVSLSKDYGWTAYMRDVWKAFLAARPAGRKG